MTSAPDTVTQAVALLEADGYTEDLNLHGRTAVCGRCSAAHDLAEDVIERQYRFEGPTDPADEAIVMGLRCRSCNACGVVVSAYGPDADPELFAWLARLPRRRP